MVTQPRPSIEGDAGASRDSTAASVWRELNHFVQRVGAVVGFLAGIGFLGLATITGEPAFYLSSLVAAIVGATGLYGILRPTRDAELVVITSALVVVTSSGFASPLVRGGLWAAIAVLAMIGGFILPRHKQPRFLASMAILLLGQLIWPIIGQANLSDAIANLIISSVCVAAGVLTVTAAKRALDESERTRIEIFRGVPVGLFRSSPSGELIDANPALAQMLGYEAAEDLIGRNVADLHDNRDDWDTLSRSLEDDREPQRFANRLRQRQGAVIWARGFARAVRDDDGAIMFYEGSIEDVTQRHEAERISQVHAERFKNVFERAPIAIWEEDFSQAGKRIETLRASGVTDLRAHLKEHPEETRRLLELVTFTDVNPAGIALVGASSKDEAFALVQHDTAPAEVVEGFMEEFVAISEDRSEMTIEIAGVTAEGTLTELMLSWAVGRCPDGLLDLDHVVVAIQDVAIIRKAERELAALVDSKDELIAAVSHELRTPITTILGMASELRDHGASFSVDETSEFVSLIADQSRELSNIVEDLLVAARTEAGTQAIRPEMFEIGAEISRIMSIGPSAVEVIIDQPAAVWADPLRVRQILRNLLSNANRYGGDRVSIEAETTANLAVVRVRDDGAGVPESDRDSIFEPYVRSTGDAALPGSLGLGLPVSRNLARLMGGDLTYFYDGSSVFELTLPIEPESAAA